MRLILLFTFLLSAYFSFSQTESDTSKPISLIKIVDVANTTKNDLYNKSLTWCAESFKDHRNAVTFSDQETGIIIGNASFVAYKIDKKNRKQPINYNLRFKIEVKDNRSRISYTDIYYELSSTSNHLLTTSEMPPFDILLMSTKNMKLYWKSVKLTAIDYLENLTNYYITSVSSKADEW